MTSARITNRGVLSVVAQQTGASAGLFAPDGWTEADVDALLRELDRGVWRMSVGNVVPRRARVAVGGEVA